MKLLQLNRKIMRYHLQHNNTKSIQIVSKSNTELIKPDIDQVYKHIIMPLFQATKLSDASAQIEIYEHNINSNKIFEVLLKSDNVESMKKLDDEYVHIGNNTYQFVFSCDKMSIILDKKIDYHSHTSIDIDIEINRNPQEIHPNSRNPNFGNA